jgi:hypothetical protein
MTEFSDGLVVGLLIGTLVGIPIGWILAQAFLKPQPSPSSVVFDRDKETGAVSAIHYVPAGQAR